MGDLEVLEVLAQQRLTTMWRLSGTTRGTTDCGEPLATSGPAQSSTPASTRETEKRRTSAWTPCRSAPSGRLELADTRRSQTTPGALCSATTRKTCNASLLSRLH